MECTLYIENKDAWIQKYKNILDLPLLMLIPSTNLPPTTPATPILAEPLTSAPIEDPAGTPVPEFHCSSMVRTLPFHLPLSHCGIDALHKTGIGG